MKNHFGCPVQATSHVLAGKWKVLIVWHLSFASHRFAELRDLLPGIIEKVLTAQLRQSPSLPSYCIIGLVSHYGQ